MNAVQKSKHFWRKHYPWFFYLFILLFGILRGTLANKDPVFALNIYMISAFTGSIFMFIFYIYGVRPDELEDWHKKYRK